MRSRRRDARRLRPEKRRGRRGRSPLGRSDAPPPRLRPGAWGWRLPASSGAVRTRAAGPPSWGAIGKCCGRARAAGNPGAMVSRGVARGHRGPSGEARDTRRAGAAAGVGTGGSASGCGPLTVWRQHCGSGL
ncbi:uncharacterized protein AAG666_025079 isoform 1-T1 [Megaptera novaeangliae]